MDVILELLQQDPLDADDLVQAMKPVLRIGVPWDNRRLVPRQGEVIILENMSLVVVRVVHDWDVLLAHPLHIVVYPELPIEDPEDLMYRLCTRTDTRKEQGMGKRISWVREP